MRDRKSENNLNASNEIKRMDEPPAPLHETDSDTGLYDVQHYAFELGACYLFFADDDGALPLWGIFDARIGDRIMLEVSSSDLFVFQNWVQLPVEYHLVRMMTRNEQRDFCFNCGYAAALQHAREEREEGCGAYFS